jgi:hypothetical protein
MRDDPIGTIDDRCGFGIVVTELCSTIGGAGYFVDKDMGLLAKLTVEHAIIWDSWSGDGAFIRVDGTAKVYVGCDCYETSFTMWLSDVTTTPDRAQILLRDIEGGYCAGTGLDGLSCGGISLY